MSLALPLAGLRVLVTRPAAQAGPLAEGLRAGGAEVLSLPLLEILPPQDRDAARERLHAAHQAHFWLFTSANAVRGAARLDDDGPAAWPETLFAIGRGTANALAALGREALAPEGATSEALLMWPELQSVAGLQVLIVTGEGGRGLLAEVLAERGALVRVARCYRRVRLGHPPEQVAAALAASDIVLITGAESLEALIALTPAAARPALLALPLVVPSARVVELARRHGWTGALLVPDAVSDAAYLARLLRWRLDSMTL